MVRKDVIREKILGLGADVCGFGGMERFTEASTDFRPIDLYPDCKSVIAVGIALPKGLLRVEPRLIYGHFNEDVVHKVDEIVFSAAKIIGMKKSGPNTICWWILEETIWARSVKSVPLMWKNI